VALKRAPVGDRYVMDQLLQGGWTLGGESSGHIICLDRTTTGDGIVSALQVLEFMIRSGCTLHELKAGMTKYPQHMINVPLEPGFNPLQAPAVTSAVAEAEAELGGAGRLLLRPSGTEPVVRVMVEGMDAQQVKGIAQRLAAVIGREQAHRAGRAGNA
jgi:phosphoglucosamine mutase